MYNGCDSLVDVNGKLYQVCDPDYVLMGKPFLKMIYGFSFFALTTVVFIFLCEWSYVKYKEYKNGKARIRDLISTILATLLMLAALIGWLLYAIQNI